MSYGQGWMDCLDPHLNIGQMKGGLGLGCGCSVVDPLDGYCYDPGSCTGSQSIPDTIWTSPYPVGSPNPVTATGNPVTVQNGTSSVWSDIAIALKGATGIFATRYA